MTGSGDPKPYIHIHLESHSVEHHTCSTQEHIHYFGGTLDISCTIPNNLHHLRNAGPRPSAVSHLSIKQLCAKPRLQRKELVPNRNTPPYPPHPRHPPTHSTPPELRNWGRNTHTDNQWHPAPLSAGHSCSRRSPSPHVHNALRPTSAATFSPPHSPRRGPFTSAQRSSPRPLRPQRRKTRKVHRPRFRL